VLEEKESQKKKREEKKKGAGIHVRDHMGPDFKGHIGKERKALL